MLDDQNESLQKLRQNLENKVRESHSSQSDLSSRQQQLQDQIDLELQVNSELKKEIETQEAVIKQFQSLVHEYKDERDRLRVDLATVSAKLSERNASIETIEREVVKVRDVFKRKEAQLALEKEDALKRKDLEHVEMRLTYEVSVLL